jgi:N-methylhydantoinase A
VAKYRVGIDIGGTFTDFTVVEAQTGAVRILKTPSNATTPEQAIFDGLAALARDHAIHPDEIEYFIHGTTLAVNTIIQRRGLATGLLVTAGFRDILNIGRHRIPDVFNFFTDVPAPLATRAHTYEIGERALSDGRIHRQVDEAAVRAAARHMQAAGVEATAICFLHSYRNGTNEARARNILLDETPGLHVSLSSEIWPQMREYERALAAVMNAYVGRRMERYFHDLEAGLRRRGMTARVLSTKSNGGIMPAAEAGARPVETLLSGPASGVIGAAFLGAACGQDRLITFDMGGTSADVAVIEGAPMYSTESQVGDFPVILPAVDVTSIGAGGGSIAWTEAGGTLKVGPESAGARPGPACYGLGGTHATVTDAYVCLGIIDPDKFLGGTVKLHPDLARDAIAHLGEQLGLGVTETAEAVLRVATSQMYAALVPLLARKGVDYEDYALLAFGGGGPCHAFLLAANVGIRRVLVPLHPGTLCAAGSLAADVRKDLVQTIHCQLADPAPVLARMAQAVTALAAKGEAWLDSLGLDLLARRQEWTAEMRYIGQSFELAVVIDAATLADATGKALRDKFHTLYRQVYGHADEHAGLEILDIRATVIGVNPKPRLALLPSDMPPEPPVRRRAIYHEGQTLGAQVFDRATLSPGFTFDGPAIIEQYDTTVFVTPGFHVHVDPHGNLIGDATRAI